MAKYDLIVAGGTLVMPYVGTRRGDIAAKDGRIVAIADALPRQDADTYVDARGKLVFPGAVDAHFHIGIYRPIDADAESETRSALVGGVTTVVSYFRTGGHYLNKSGPYREIFPEVLSATAGHAYTDYAYHLAIMTSAQVQEVDWLVREMGVASFKYYMFYKGLNLSASSTDTSSLTMSDVYDLGHLYRMMQAIAGAAEKYREAGRVSLSLHCEHSEIMRTMIDEVKAKGIEGLEAYHLARPPFQERLAIAEATLLADVTGCPVNLLHLSSGEALSGGVKARRDYPTRDIRLETTLHHLALTYDSAGGIERGKVNPPIRTAEDNAALWAGVLRGDIDQIVSDHACCMLEHKQGGTWEAYAGFGGTSLLYPIVFSEGRKRGLRPERIAELVSANPARTTALYPRKGTLDVGGDADITVIDPDLEAPVTTERLLSAQDHTAFEGFRVRGWPTHTIVGGRVQLRDGKVVGRTDGGYVKRPVAMFP
jgi:dihydropyrimidinase/allantoinase